MPRYDRALFLHEEVLLLALRNEKGTIAAGTMYTQAMGGAILAELLLRDRIRAMSEGRSTYAAVTSARPLGDPVLDECLEKLAGAKRRGKLQTWVGRFAGLRRLKHRVAAMLVDKGALRASEDTVLLLFTRRIYPQLDGRFERAVIDRLHTAVFGDAATVDPRTVVLVALAHHSGLLKANFDRKALKARRHRIEAMLKGDLIGKATREAIEAVHAAVVVAAVMPAVFAATSSH